MNKKIIHGNCLEIIPDLGVFDYLITDPPYPPGGGSVGVRATGSVMGDSRVMADSMSQTLVFEAIQKIRKNPNFSVWMFCDFRQVSFYSFIFRQLDMNKQSCIIWDKIKIGMGKNYRCSHELILFASTGTSINTGFRDVIAHEKVKSNDKTHMFEKPPEIIEKICAHFPKGRVIDPFCGTGGLLVGAHRLKWDVVGIDMERKFCDIAESRLTGESNKLF